MPRLIVCCPVGGWGTIARTSAFLLVALGASVALAELPNARLNGVFPVGGKQGSTVELSLAGEDLDDLTGLHFSHPGITAQPKLAPPAAGKPPQPVPMQFVAQIAADVPRGVYEVRAAGRYGISNPRAFLVGKLNEIVDPEGNDRPATALEVALETTVNGKLSAERSEFFKFQAKQGERVTIDCWAHRCDSRADATLVLRDAKGNELARNNDAFRRDPFLDFTAPADGAYTVEIFDFLHRGGSPEFVYRLHFTSAPTIDFVFPAAGLPGSKGTYALFGRNLPGGAKTDQKGLDGRVLDRLDVTIELPADPLSRSQLPQASLVEPQDSGLDAFLYRLSTPQGESNGVPIFYATAPVALEQEPNDLPTQATKVAPPCEVAGQFNPKKDQDWITFDAKAGEQWYLEVYSERLGLSTDPYLLVQRVQKNDKGEEVAQDVVELDDPKLLPQDQRNATSYDISHGDLVYKLSVPSDGTYRVLVRDLYNQSRGCGTYCYRLAIRKPSPDFRLIAVGEPPVNPQNQNQTSLWSPLLRRGGTQALRIHALRQDDFEGEITVSVEGLPAGVTCPELVLGPGATTGNLIFSAAEDAPAWSGTLKISGKAKINGAEVTHLARAGTVVFGTNDRNQQPIRARMAGDVALAVSGAETAVSKIEVAPGQTPETSLAGKIQLPVKVVRRGDFKGNLKLVPIGLPKDIRLTEVDIAGGAAEGQVTLEVKNTALPGTYTFALQGFSQVSYRRNPEAAEAADKAFKELQKKAEEVAAKFKTASDAKAEAEKAANEAAAIAKQTADAAAAATKQVQEHENTLKTAADTFAAAKAATDAKADDAAAATKKSESLKAIAEALEKLRVANEAKAVADRGAVEMNAKMQSSAAAKAAAETSFNQVNAEKTATDAERTAAENRAKETAEAAKPKNVDATFVTMPVTVRIAPAPITLAAAAPSSPVKPGDKPEIPVTINRLFGFAENVSLSIVPADPAGGLKSNEISVNKDQPTGKLVLEVAPNAKPGDQAITLRAKLNLNGQALTVDQPLVVKVEAPPAK